MKMYHDLQFGNKNYVTVLWVQCYPFLKIIIRLYFSCYKFRCEREYLPAVNYLDHKAPSPPHTCLLSQGNIIRLFCVAEF
jgi:hypothetical protein